VLAIMPASVLPSAGQTASALRTNPFAAQWLACTIPYRRFAPSLAAGNARLGADVGRYSFIAVDFHHLLLAGLPAHLTPIYCTRIYCSSAGQLPERWRSAPICRRFLDLQPKSLGVDRAAHE